MKRLNIRWAAFYTNHFAWMEALLVMATILQKMTFTLDPASGPMELEPMITLRPKGGLPVIGHSRNDERNQAEVQPLTLEKR